MYTHMIVRTPSKSMIKGLRRDFTGEPDYELALKQHQAYIDALESLGMVVDVLPPLEEYPDACFVEDVAVVTEKMAIVTSPGAESRNGEKEHIVEALKKYYPEDKIHYITEGFVEGGDIVRVDDHFYLGDTERSNEAGRKQFIEIVKQYGFTGSVEPTTSGLHIGCDMMYIKNNNLVITGDLLNNPVFDKYNKVIASEEEAYAANVAWINGTVLMAQGYPKLEKQIKDLGYDVITIDNSEFKKIDGSITCLSLRFKAMK
ncbi:MAG: N(G),N(G)-dimethylarginine dimethylaminohydrolase [Tissierella sp.]|nr:N(G),N(G)-dimethylarginine dimethylaminohydrolase [Tissierella sp.]